MLLIFRKLRRSFFLPGKVRTYLAYAVGEIILIVVGILLALQISEWNQARKDRLEEQLIIIALLDEFRENKNAIKYGRDFNNDLLETEENLMSLTIEAEPKITIAEMDKLISASNWFWGRYRFSFSTLNSVLQSGKLHLVNSDLLRQKLAGWAAVMEKVRIGQSQDYITWHEDWIPYLRKHIYLPQITNASEGEPGGDPHPSLSVPMKPIVRDHRNILADLEFQNLLIQRWWVQWDILRAYDEFEAELDEVISLMEKALEK